MKPIDHTTETLRSRTKLNPETGCWEWAGFREPKGYGIVVIRKYPMRAHRHMWTVTYGPIPDGLWVLHKCDNPPCVNPDHLFLGTHADNMADCKAKGRQTRLLGDRNASRRRPERVCRGEKVGTAVLKAEDVMDILKRYSRRKVTQKQLAAEFGVSQTTIFQIVHRRHWRHLTCPPPSAVV